MKKLFVSLLVVSLLCSACVVNLSAADYGDINCDGEVRVSDAVLLAQYLAQWSVNISAEGMAAADVRYDGEVNIKDAVLLAQHLAQWHVSLGPDSNPGVDTDPSTPPSDSEVVPEGGDNEIPGDDIF